MRKNKISLDKVDVTVAEQVTTQLTKNGYQFTVCADCVQSYSDKKEFSKEEYKLADEVIKPIFYNATQNHFSFAKYGVDCYLAGRKAGRPEWHKVADGDLPKRDERFSGNVSITVMT